MEFLITDNPSKSRFETKVQNDVAYLEYHLFEKMLALTHTFVPEEHRHQGIAYALIRFALDHAASQKLSVIPYCSSIVKFLEDYPEYEEKVEILWS